MFRRVLIANRGEIALRVIRACREMGIRTIAVHSQADADSLHVRYADEAVCIGPAPSQDSYLNIPSIISAAEITDAQAIHPGYGFLAESARFAEICKACNIVFIGPSVEAIALTGDKFASKLKMRKAGIPVVPGGVDEMANQDDAIGAAREIGYPVMVKSAGGGGGRGMRIATNDYSLASAFRTAQAEAEAAFGESKVYLEKYFEGVRHVEIQLLADNSGNVIHLGERECSIQRRYQKLIEESPSPGITQKQREELARAAVKAAKLVGYTNAGTVEFLVDGQGKFFFIEFNSRIQVEHPVTESVLGIDLVKEQIRLATGQKLRIKQDKTKPRGAAIECRVYAEDPDDGFRPCAGTIEAFHVPGGPGVRVDTHAYAGYEVPPYYDAMLAKVVAWGHDRKEAIMRVRRALDEMVIEGVKTTIPLTLRVLSNASFRRGEINTEFLESFVRSQ